jgi:hypothetical protein
MVKRLTHSIFISLIIGVGCLIISSGDAWAQTHSWVLMEGGDYFPPDSVSVNRYKGRVFLCRTFFDGRLYVGETTSNGCEFLYSGRENRPRVFRAPVFEVLTGRKGWWGRPGEETPALSFGVGNNKVRFVCRAYSAGGFRSGELVDGVCKYERRGVELKSSRYEVFYPQSKQSIAI